MNGKNKDRGRPWRPGAVALTIGAGSRPLLDGCARCPKRAAGAARAGVGKAGRREGEPIFAAGAR